MRFVVRRLIGTWIILMIMVFANRTFAIDQKQLAEESEAYVKTTAKETPTPPEVIISKVDEACTLLSKEGKGAFSKFKGKGSKFLFEGTYIWIHSLQDSVMLMHPIKYKMVGNKLIGLKDIKGKRFFVTMNNKVKEKGAAWVEYYWPRPGTNEIVRKVSYVKKCKTLEGKEVVIGCGIYNLSESDLTKLEIF